MSSYIRGVLLLSRMSTLAMNSLIINKRNYVGILHKVLVSHRFRRNSSLIRDFL